MKRIQANVHVGVQDGNISFSVTRPGKRTLTKLFPVTALNAMHDHAIALGNKYDGRWFASSSLDFPDEYGASRKDVQLVRKILFGNGATVVETTKRHINLDLLEVNIANHAAPMELPSMRRFLHVFKRKGTLMFQGKKPLPLKLYRFQLMVDLSVVKHTIESEVK
jgi:hypothetical protein